MAVGAYYMRPLEAMGIFLFLIIYNMEVLLPEERLYVSYASSSIYKSK